MHRREFLKATGASTLALTLGLIESTVIGASQSNLGTNDKGFEKPDVLVIMTDQWNPRCVGYESDPNVKTPNLDKLAKEGIIFDSNYSPCPVCMPARASLITGLYPHENNLWGNSNEWYVFPHIAPMFQDIQKAGVTTCQLGKLHWTGGSDFKREFASEKEYHKALGLDHCMDIATPFSTRNGSGPYRNMIKKMGLMEEYSKDMTERLKKNQYMVRPSVVSPEYHNDSFVADKAIEFIKKQPKSKPYCLVASFPGPHTPLDAPGKYAKMYDPDKIELPPNVPENMHYSGTDYDRNSIREARANYFGKISLIDYNVGRIVEETKKRGRWDNTLVIFTSDHGEMIGAQGKMSKGKFWEESARVPLFLHWPKRIKPGQRSKALTQLFDVYPTIVEAVGGELSSGHSAVSLLPIATGKTNALRDEVFSEISHRGHFDYMVRTKSFKWFKNKDQEYLFDMVNDPYEMHNLINVSEYGEVVKKLKQRHYRYLMEINYDYSANYVPLVNRTRQETAK
jgi:arylsulfatase A-like enzyme